MKKSPFKRKATLLALTTVIGLSASSIVLAAANAGPMSPVNPVTPPNFNSTKIVTAINDLGHNMEKLAFSGAKAVNNAMYQIDKDLPNIMTLNNGKGDVKVNINNKPVTGIPAITKQTAIDQTLNDIQNNLQQLPDTALTFNEVTPQVKVALQRDKAQQGLTTQLTLGTPASDTLYSDVSGIDNDTSDTNGYKMGPPKKLYNNYFNFGSLMAPSRYSANQLLAAHRFVTYLSQNYQPLSSSIDFSSLKSVLNSEKEHPAKLAHTLYNFVNSKAYKTYQLATRSAMAGRSIALSNLNKIMAERSPIETTKENNTLAAISTAIGITPSTVINPQTHAKVYVYASPLEISNYIANHRTDSQQWYQRMAKASPATVQRETLYVMAEMESMMQRQHLDSERMIATLSAMQLQAQSMEQKMLEMKAMAVNKEINTLTNKAGSTSMKLGNKETAMQRYQQQELNSSGSDKSNPKNNNVKKS